MLKRAAGAPSLHEFGFHRPLDQTPSSKPPKVHHHHRHHHRYSHRRCRRHRHHCVNASCQ